MSAVVRVTDSDTRRMGTEPRGTPRILQDVFSDRTAISSGFNQYSADGRRARSLASRPCYEPGPSPTATGGAPSRSPRGRTTYTPGGCGLSVSARVTLGTTQAVDAGAAGTAGTAGTAQYGPAGETKPVPGGGWSGHPGAMARLVRD